MMSRDIDDETGVQAEKQVVKKLIDDLIAYPSFFRFDIVMRNIRNRFMFLADWCTFSPSCSECCKGASDITRVCYSLNMDEEFRRSYWERHHGELLLNFIRIRALIELEEDSDDRIAAP